MMTMMIMLMFNGYLLLDNLVEKMFPYWNKDFDQYQLKAL